MTEWANAAPFNGRTEVYRSSETVDIYYEQITGALSFPRVVVNNTLQIQKGKGLGNYYTYANALSALKLVEGAMELLGEFWRFFRDGSFGRFQISQNQNVEVISNSDREVFWWDENDVEAIGKVDVTMKSSNGDKIVRTFKIGNGKSVYYMQDNELMLNTDSPASDIQYTLRTYFAPNAAVVNFTPVDLDKRGLPYLEAGDKIQLTTDDGETVQTYILQQTISGIQQLRAEVISTNGEIMEVA